ncbi:pac motif [Lucifera butyrica]|uniref:Pac motif n=1 Tax=Lucifera butyrica TaxID=1351585 RepID=A0A498R1G2_9FIRM|nr:diguanylate cyclase [Lucifera butyrica]VBB05049.1 pac motif [Lucifera butyrica]
MPYDSSIVSEEQGLTVFYQLLFEQSADATVVCEIDKNGRLKRFIRANHMACTKLEYTEAELLGLHPLETVKTDLSSLDNLLKKLLLQKTVSGEITFLTKTGIKRPAEISASLLTFQDRHFLICTARDITPRKRAEQSLRRVQTRNQALINAIPDLMFEINKAGLFNDFKTRNHFDFFNPAAEVIQQNINHVLPPPLAGQIMHFVHKTLVTGQAQSFEFQFPIHGSHHEWEARLVPSGPDSVLSIIRDITDRKQMENQLKYLSWHDSLTGLYNRAFFEEELQRLTADPCQPLGIIVCDMDGLKLANDTLGHATGDELLLQAAKIIKNSLRNDDVLARIGGDEFAIILPHAPVPVVESICRRIRNAITNYNVKNHGHHLSISIGFAVSSHCLKDLKILFKEADNKMYREKLLRKQTSRNTTVETVMKLLEARDFITEGHANRLQEFVANLGLSLELPRQKIADLCLLAKFHDIGKVGIPDRILFKPAPLTPEEKIEMQRHAEIGHRIACAAADLSHIAGWILKHHEWWNGKGYPLGLKEKDIPLECRILSIADAYDAMTNERPYRKALSREDAIAELIRGAGRQFDPDLVFKFINNVLNN